MKKENRGKKQADLLGPTPYPGSTPQAESENLPPLSMGEMQSLEKPKRQEMNWFYGNGKLEVSPSQSHDELRESAGVSPDSRDPAATGYIDLIGSKAAWSISTNTDPKEIEPILEEYTERNEWDWDGLFDGGGNPVHGDNMKKAMFFRWANKHLYLSPALIENHDGKLFIDKNSIRISSAIQDKELDEAIAEWASDNNYRLAEYPGGGQMTERIKTWEDLDTKGWSENPPEPMKEDEPKGDFKCPKCGQELNDFMEYQMHMTYDHHMKDYDSVEEGHFPWPGDIDDPLPARRKRTEPGVSPIAKTALMEPKDVIEQDIPFIYDVEKDSMTFGEQGQKVPTIQGDFTPGGIVAGYYQSGGKMLITNTTDIPYTTRHMIELWYAYKPKFQVKNVSMQMPDGKEWKIA